jgi:hypothetical protein
MQNISTLQVQLYVAASCKWQSMPSELQTLLV